MATVVSICVIKEYLFEMFLLHTDESLDKVDQFVGIVADYGSRLKAEERQKLTGSDELAVGQQVLARSSVNDGQWCNAVVISTGHR